MIGEEFDFRERIICKDFAAAHLPNCSNGPVDQRRADGAALYRQQLMGVVAVIFEGKGGGFELEFSSGAVVVGPPGGKGAKKIRPPPYFCWVVEGFSQKLAPVGE